MGAKVRVGGLSYFDIELLVNLKLPISNYFDLILTYSEGSYSLKLIPMSYLKLFEGSEIRARWDDDEDQWYFVVQDVIGFLTDSVDPSKYWHDMKRRSTKNEGIELSANCRRLKFKAPNGKVYKYECANNETIFRIIQSIPSPKAEPFKQWLAKLGKERIDEIEQPQKAIERAEKYYTAKGRNSEWISDRTSGIKSRNELTSHWQSTGVKGIEYGILTNEIYTTTFGMDAVEYKLHKGITKGDSLRDNMTTIELVLTRFAEVSAKEIGEGKDYKGLEGNKKAIREGGAVVNGAIKDLESKSGRKVVSKENFKHMDTTEKTKEIITSESKELSPPLDEDL